MKNSSENKFEKKQTSLIKNCSVINKRVLNVIKKANVQNNKELLKFLNSFIIAQFKNLQEKTKDYLDIVEVDAKNSAFKDDLKPNNKIIQTIKYQTFIELNSNLICAERETMDNFKSVIKKFNDEPANIFKIKEALQSEFIKNGGVGITYKNGAKIPLDKYFMMATRTARNETQNLTAIDDARRLETDLVYLQPNNSTSCKFCSSFGGRVYSISGQDKRFPALYDKLFKNGYHCIHPNCKCQIRPFFEEFHSYGRNKELIKQSNREWNLDDRTEKQRQLYQEQQSFNHNQWSSKLRFDQVKEIYGEDSPYKTLKGFRIGKTTNSSNYQKVKNMLNDKNQYERWIKIIGKDNMPKSLAEFQDLKYNKIDEFNLLQREKNTIKDIKNKNWTDTFKSKAIDTYYEFRKDNIELTDHGVARLIQRDFDKQLIMEICNTKPFNYVQKDNRYIKLYGNIAIIYNSKKQEIVSIVARSKPKGDWNEIKN